MVAKFKDFKENRSTKKPAEIGQVIGLAIVTGLIALLVVAVIAWLIIGIYFIY